MKKLDAVFIQPTYSCALNCKGCYVKESVQADQLSLETLNSLIRYLWVTSRYDIRQVTIAVDNIPEDNALAQDIMVAVLSTAVRMRKLYGKKIALHITCNTTETLEDYWDYGGLDFTAIARGVDLISFSHLHRDRPRLNLLRQYTRVNYNYIPSTGTVDEYLDTLQYVDMSYLVLKKGGLGRINNPLDIQLYKETLARIRSHPHADKVVVDGCVRDAAGYIRTGFGCSANVSRLHIWPDGHVTGCPYNKDGSMPATNMTGILDNIEEALRRYEFNSCTIPRDYFSNKPALRVITG